MTNTLTLRSFDIPSIHKFAVGFDNIFDELQRVSAQQTNNNYPPYNVIKHDDNKFVIELAVAGFREGDINVTVDKNLLTIVGEKIETLDELNKDVEYLHRGISSRSFSRTFTLADHVEVSAASVSNGILSVTLERQIPEELKPKKIAITFNK
jgi:molecular chaperone IbpA